jgi:hypothetical protein
MTKKLKSDKSAEGDENLNQYIKEQKQRIKIVKKVLSKLKTIPNTREKK